MNKLFTKNKEVQAFVAHVLIDKHPLIVMDATAEEANKVPVL